MNGLAGLFGCALFALIFVVFVLLVSGLRVAQEYERAVVFRLGRFSRVKGPGLYWNIPMLEWQRKE